MDEAIIELMVSDSPLNVINKFIPLDDINVNLANIFRNSSCTDEYINTFIRTTFFWPNPDEMLLNNLTYKAYMKLMFDWYSGNGKSLKPLYKLVQNAVTSWKGQAGPGRINIDIGRQQLEYRASESIKFKPPPVNITPKNEEQSHIFNAFLPLSYKVDDCLITLSITYNLYSLVKAINEGYRPTSLDHSNFIVFNEFVQKMETSSETQKQVFFTDSANKQQFILELDDFGDFCFSEVTQ
jgi:DNA phosphorothioation-dependent restriction protein DptF